MAAGSEMEQAQSDAQGAEGQAEALNRIDHVLARMPKRITPVFGRGKSSQGAEAQEVC